ncbi:MAG TPA: ATP-binding cassette domain-containing protein [Pseudolysinimonas sp.]|nr:ATP-binding cassette domain-containing protein [Pseudolysinimonas sp.]
MSAGLVASGVRRMFPAGGGVESADLAMRPGEIVALVGLNGAGKTTLMRLLLGMLRAESGRVELDGVPLERLPGSTWAAVGHLVDAPLVYPELTTRTALELNARLRGAGRGVVEAALQDFGLTEYAGRRIRALSLGNRQRVGLAAALQHRPQVIVLDEPTNGLDPAGVIALREQLLARRDDGAAVLVSSHHLDEVARTADRIVVLNAGRLIGELAPHSAGLESMFFEMLLRDDEVRA